jgi:hypothetical protein
MLVQLVEKSLILKVSQKQARLQSRALSILTGPAKMKPSAGKPLRCARKLLELLGSAHRAIWQAARACQNRVRGRHSLSKAAHATQEDVSHNFQPQRSHLNCSGGLALDAVLPQCGHFIVQM